MNSSDIKNRIGISGVIIILFFAILVIKLWQLQVLQSKAHKKTSTENMLRIIRSPAPRGIIYDRNGEPLVKNSPYFYASFMLENLKTTDINLLAGTLGISSSDIQEKISKEKQSAFDPIRLKDGLTLKEIAILEARRSDFPGLIIETDIIRDYPFGTTGAHVIGYLGRLNLSQSKNPEFKDVPQEAFIGQWGAEMLFDKTLRGIAGEKVIEVDALGREIRLIQETPPIRGADLALSIDITLQKTAEEAFGQQAGAFVAMRTDTGEILGLVSKPSFNPNIFAKGINYKQWSDLINDKKVPMFNRALQSQQPPGSTFKIIMAVAGLSEKVITPATTINCSGGIKYGNHTFGCWKKGGHGAISFHRAVVESCDVYFYELGRRLGIEKIAEYAKKLGLGSETGLPLVKEKKGLIPSERWKYEARKQQWYLGDTFNTSIGQGAVLATPIQMAHMMSIVASNGKVFSPTLLKTETAPEPAAIVDIKPEVFELVKKALTGVVNESGGTALSSRSSIVKIGGKTGTAQVVQMNKGFSYASEKFRDHAWFVAFAPVEKPEVALCTFVEHGGHGSSAAAPIAKKAIEAYFTNEKLKNQSQNNLKQP
jgi:penicillin-binding protein 2